MPSAQIRRNTLTENSDKHLGIRVLQINANRSRQALDLALETGQKIGASFLLVSEPNKLAIKHRKDWISDEKLDTAIKLLNRQIVVKDQGYGPGFTFVTTPDITIYSCYSSGKKDITELESTLYYIAKRIRLKKENAVVAGDFNAKSPAWGMPNTDDRGQLMTEWIAENNMSIANRGFKPTFQRLNCASILDLTIATESLIGKVEQWEVSEEETLSDHNYITFDIAERPPEKIQQYQKHKGWQIRKLDERRLEEAIDKADDTHSTAEGLHIS